MRTKEKEMAIFLDEIFPQIQGRFEIVELYESGALVKMKIINDDLRPGNTVSGPSMFSLADISFYVAVLPNIGKEALAVATGCSINFLRKPEADMLYGKIMKTQNWRLLRYLDSILLSLYEKDSSARYTQYNLSWPLLNRLRWDGAKIKAIANTLSKKLHISNSTFATFFFPFILTLKENDSIELEFEDTYEELLEKEIELLK